MYKVGDRVLFSFLSGDKVGVIIKRVDKVKWKIRSDDGTVYPFIFTKKPTSKKKGETVLGFIIKKL